ncbi:S1/P1 nuclease (plasmid) [Polymorphobacter sp. PAMC 29334]|uniref:S1/P1 nuclease n=1 Tax=Polymorphobacter sp. PAMC 29334 TaxID=2862331 RepID=UPI001C7547A3|nr:S1/P1 nuclease [Polymorphobacter sp. PAMC 29334]QYE33148.1 S1/P1 nuclease [Polymorphobacter sp. PAMC 29334]
MRAIADIAWTQLTPAAKRDLAQLLAAAPDLATPACPVGSFEDGAIWADCVRSQYRDLYAQTATWHYVDVSICRTFQLPEDRDARYVVRRYQHELAVLSNHGAPPAVRLEALLWVEHLVGDLHQPLHIGDDDDRGGNEVQIRPQSGRYPLNLHAEWDRVLVDDTVRATPGGVAGLAAAAANHSGRARELSPTAWARESWDIAGRVAYGRALDANYCDHGHRSIDVGEDYRFAAIPIVQTQIERAGVRLAAVLNSVLR